MQDKIKFFLLFQLKPCQRNINNRIVEDSSFGYSRKSTVGEAKPNQSRVTD